jgi:hypothetical protein
VCGAASPTPQPNYLLPISATAANKPGSHPMTAETMQDLVITLPEHTVKYLENISKYTAETASEIIKGLVYNHFIRHFEIINGKHRQKIKGKPFADYATEREFLEYELEAWPKNSIGYKMIHSRLNALGDRPLSASLIFLH